MQAINNPFVSIINGNKQFIIPVFQRDYSWTTEQCGQIWNDVVRSGGGDDGSHFMGSFVYVAGNTGAVFSTWLVIDGQQRLTTLTLLLIALRDHIRDTDWAGGNPDDPTVDQIDAYFLKNVQETGERTYKLALRRHDNDTLRALVDGDDSSEVSNASELVVEAYQHFRELLALPDTDPAEVYRGIARLDIVDVKLERRIDNPQLVFESLNSTGVDLTESDLIRNYLLMGLPDEEQTRLYNAHWSRLEILFRECGSSPDQFLRDYIALKQKSTTQARADRIYAEFKDFWTPSGEMPLDTLLEDMVRFAGYYASCIKPERIASKTLSDSMRRVRWLGSAHVLLTMRLNQCHDDGMLSLDEFTSALELISSYLVRRAVLGLESRNYWAVFARIAHSVDDTNPFESFQVALARQNYTFPSDERFIHEIQDRDIYGLRICWHILTQLENFGQAEPSPTSEYSIEHIMPQSIGEVQEWQQMLGEGWEAIHESWLHRLGNLTLTAYNSRYSNRPFAEKLTIDGGFNQSAVRLNHFVREQNRWTVSEMEERGKKLAKRAVEIWPYHDADDELLRRLEVEELFERASMRDADNLEMNGHVRELLYILRDAVRELGDIIEVIEGRSSICYYDDSASFFAETLAMAHRVRVLLPIDFDEADDPEGVATDVTRYKFLQNVVHRDCGIFVDIWSHQQIAATIPLIRQAFNVSEE